LSPSAVVEEHVGRAPASLRWLAIATAGATWVLLLVGCLVHGTGSSLACPDWPLCYGSALPKMQNGVQFEHSHRLVATAVGLLSIALAVLLHRRRKVDRDAAKTARMGYLGVGLVCVQGLLGGITVLLRLPIVITIAHLVTSMVFFCLMTLIALRTLAGRPRIHAPASETGLAPLRPYVGLAAIATLAQIMLGGLVRHTASGLACFGIPLCNGELWPDQAGAHLHMTHRIFAVVLGVFVIALSVVLRRRASKGSPVAGLAMAAIVLVLVQIGLGVLSVLSLLALAPVTLHLGVAALLLVCNVALFYYVPARVPRQAAAHIGEAAGAW
jgi:heme A synthase